MIKDFAKLDNGSTVRADICIIGAGAAGIAIARELLRTRFTAVVLESGGFNPEAETQKLYDSEVVGLPHEGVHNGRAGFLAAPQPYGEGKRCALIPSTSSGEVGFPTAVGPFRGLNSIRIMNEQTACSNSVLTFPIMLFVPHLGLSLQPSIPPSFTCCVRNGVPSQISAQHIEMSLRTPPMFLCFYTRT